MGFKSGFDIEGHRGGIRAALEALQGRGAGREEGVVPGSGVEGGEHDREREGGMETERAERVAKLEIEIERLRDENRRWQEVSQPERGWSNMDIRKYGASWCLLT